MDIAMFHGIIRNCVLNIRVFPAASIPYAMDSALASRMLDR